MGDLVVSRLIFSLRLTVAKMLELTKALESPNPTPGLPPSVYPFLTAGSLKLSGSTYRFKAVVGTVNPNDIRSGGAGIPSDPDPAMTTENQITAFKYMLDTLKISYRVGKVAQILSIEARPAVPGSLFRYQSALTKAGVECRSSFTGSSPYVSPPVMCPNSVFPFQMGVQALYFEVPKNQIDQALEALKKAIPTTGHY